MAHLVKIKGLKGKQNKKKWAKNIDVSELLEAQRQQHDQEYRLQHQPLLILTDDSEKTRPPLDPNRFKNVAAPKPKPRYDNRVTRNLGLEGVSDAWGSGDQNGKRIYKPSEIPAVIAPESGHSYNPRQQDVEKLVERVIDYETGKPQPPKEKAVKPLQEAQIRYRNKKKRAAQLEARARKEQKEFNQQLHSLKKIKKEIDEREDQIAAKIKEKKIKKEALEKEARTGRVRQGKKLAKQVYRYKEYLPEEGDHQEKVSRMGLNDQFAKERFDSIFRRGILQPRTIRVQPNRRRNIKVKQRGFIQE